jgi:hypothetical protein
MKETTFQIDQALTEAIQARQVELDGIQRMLAFAWSTNEYQIPQEKIDELKADYNKTNLEYNLLRQQITNMVPEEFDKSKTSWNLDFATNTVTVIEQA